MIEFTQGNGGKRLPDDAAVALLEYHGVELRRELDAVERRILLLQGVRNDLCYRACNNDMEVYRMRRRMEGKV